MAEITASLVKELRDRTSAGMMACKQALAEAGGDIDKAIELLRKKGAAKADQKADRTASEGRIADQIAPDSRSGALVEVNCETDFVGKNDSFGDFVSQVAHAALTAAATDADSLQAAPLGNSTVGETVKAKVLELGENIVPRRAAFLALPEGTSGRITSYIHMGGKVGVLLQLACEKPDTAGVDAFATLARDICLHIAAAAPTCLDRSGVDASELEGEREIFREQMKDKPAQVIEKIIEGKLSKFYSTVCLLEQPFVKDPDQSIQQLLDAAGKTLGDTPSVTAFTRFALGQA